MTQTLEARIAKARREIRARSSDGIVRRTLPTEVRAIDSPDGGFQIIGHGAVYNSKSEDLGGFREQIQPGFFNRVVSQGPDVRALFNHDPNIILAATRNNSLRLMLDSVGLGYEADVSPAIASTPQGQYVRAVLGDGLVTQSSFAFRTGANGDQWEEDPETGGLLRTLLPNGCSGLYDVSPVTYPAYPAADSGLARAALMAEVRRLAEVRMDAPSASLISTMIYWGSEFCTEEDDADAIANMGNVLNLLNSMLGTELTEPDPDEDDAATSDPFELNSSPSTEQRDADGPTVGERGELGSDDERQADSATPLLDAADERMTELIRSGRTTA